MKVTYADLPSFIFLLAMMRMTRVATGMLQLVLREMKLGRCGSDMMSWGGGNIQANVGTR